MASGVSSSATSSAFNAGDADQAVEYRSLSIAALLGLVLGLLSPLYFGAALLILIPIVGMAVSILALLRISKSEGALAGRWAAFLGLFLSAAMIVAPNARGYVIQAMRSQQAERFGKEWLGFVTGGRAKDAFRLSNSSTVAASPRVPGEKPATVDPFDALLALPVIKALVTAGADATIRYIGTTAYDAQTFPQVFVSQQFEVTPSAKAGGQPIQVRLTMERTRVAKEGRARWIVWAIDDDSKPEVATPAKQ